MTKRELKRAINGAWSKYVLTLKRLCEAQGGELHGLAAAHELLGQPATDAYDLFVKEQKEIQDEYGRAIDAKYMAKLNERLARDRAVQAVNQARHDVSYFTEYVERERIRTKALMQFCNVSGEEADRIFAEAEAKLAGAQARLDEVLA